MKDERYQQMIRQLISLLEFGNETTGSCGMDKQLKPQTERWKYCKNSLVIAIFLETRGLSDLRIYRALSLIFGDF
jgi:hypothetical protein